LYIPQKRFHRIVGLQGYLQFIAFRLSRLLKNVPEAVAVPWDATVETAQSAETRSCRPFRKQRENSPVRLAPGSRNTVRPSVGHGSSSQGRTPI